MVFLYLCYNRARRSLTDMKLRNRAQAGEMLSKLLINYQDSDAIILAIPRGGVLVGAPISKALNLDLDIIITKKILHPHEHRAIGAIAQDGNPVFMSRDTSNIEMKWLNQQVRESRQEIAHRHTIYNKENTPLDLENKDVLLVTDGILSGLSAMAAIEECERLKANSIVLVTPSLSVEAGHNLSPMVKKLVSLSVEETTRQNVDDYYEDEEEITDGDVIKVLMEISSDKK